MQKADFIVDGDSAGQKKLPYVAPIKLSDEMDENQKKFFTNYNTMQKELIKNGLMEAK